MRRAPLLALALALLLGAAALRPDLQERQREAGLVLPSEGQTGLAADAAVPVLALGAFRGLVVDYLWLRSMGLRERGQTFESRQLAELIGRLQPRMWEVWSYLGHDLAYNVASAFDDAPSRWRWIQNGIRLLRDEGIRLNPDAPELYFMLARIYQDKIGSTADDFQAQFKNLHALQLQDILGDLAPPELAAAPPLEQVLAEPDVVALIEDARRLGLVDLPVVMEDPALAAELNLEALLPERRELVVRPAWRRLLCAVRARLLRERLRLDPARMAAVDERYGPLDWRAADASAVYWASEGARVAAQRGGDPRLELKLRRVTILALKNATRRGRIRILHEPDGRRVVLTLPLLGLSGKIDALYAEELREARERGAELDALAHDPRRGRALSHDEEEELGLLDTHLRNLAMARLDFLLEAIVQLADYGRDLAARALFAHARELYPDEHALSRGYDRFLIDYQTRRYTDVGTFDTQTGATQAVEGAWTEAFTALAAGDDERYFAKEKLARSRAEAWQRYVAGLDEPDARARLGVDFAEVRLRALRTAVQGLPSPLLRERLAQRLGVDPRALAPQGEGGPR